jgi:hypothetical protein
VGGHLQGLAKGSLAGFCINRKNNREINLILQLILFLMNRSPAAKNGGRNGIHR